MTQQPLPGEKAQVAKGQNKQKSVKPDQRLTVYMTLVIPNILVAFAHGVLN
jgi:hypothetical protein